MELYANGIKYDSTRFLDALEVNILESRLLKDKKLYKIHYFSGLFVLYACVLSVLIERSYTLWLGGNIEHSGFFVFVFCCLFPPAIGVLQEIIFSFKWRSRLLFISLCTFYLVSQLFNIFSNTNVVEWVVVLTLFLGWAVIIMRWFDAKKYLPLLVAGLKDVKNKKINRFSEQYQVYHEEDYEEDIEKDCTEGCIEDCEEEFEENQEMYNQRYILEILPESHLIYRVNDENHTKWETAEVMKVSNTNTDEFLAPWYYGLKGSVEDGLKLFQRKISQDEAFELASLSRRIKRKIIISIFPSLYISALGVRFVENILNNNIESGLSATGWAIAIALGLVYPSQWLKKWQNLRKDIINKQIISVWTSYENGIKDILLEEVLPESGLLWSQNNRPSYWRVKKFF